MDNNLLRPDRAEFTTPKKNVLEPSEFEKQKHEKHERPSAIKITKKKSTTVEIILPG